VVSSCWHSSQEGGGGAQIGSRSGPVPSVNGGVAGSPDVAVVVPDGVIQAKGSRKDDGRSGGPVCLFPKLSEGVGASSHDQDVTIGQDLHSSGRCQTGGKCPTAES